MRAAFVLPLCLLATSADAEPWYKGQYGTNRIVNLAVTGGGLLLYPAMGFLESNVECRWCGGPNELDHGVRDALVWSSEHRETASTISDVTSWGALGITSGFLLAGTMPDTTWANAIDDVVPVLETMMITAWVTRAIKIGAARTRPYAHFTSRRSSEDNLSFPSGHTSRAFAIATSAGMVAHARGYWSEPYVWAIGMTLATASGYLRIAADRHYLTDVLVGGAIGVTAGLTVPLLMRRTNVETMPTATGIAFSGAW